MNTVSSDTKRSAPLFLVVAIAVIATVIGVVVGATLGIIYLPGSRYFSNDLAMILGAAVTSAFATVCVIGFAVLVKRDFAKMRRAHSTSAP